MYTLSDSPKEDGVDTPCILGVDSPFSADVSREKLQNQHKNPLNSLGRKTIQGKIIQILVHYVLDNA